MKAILTTSLFLVIASAHFSFAQNRTTTKTVTTKIESTSIDEPSKDSVSEVETKRVIFKSFSKLGVSLGVYNFWQPARDLSTILNTPLPAGRRFGAGLNYQFSMIVRNKHWFGWHADLIINWERRQYGYSSENVAANFLFNYGFNVKKSNSSSPLYPFISAGVGGTSLILSSTDNIQASNLNTQVSTIRIATSYFAYKIGIATMDLNKKGFPESIIQIGYLGGIDENDWISGRQGKVEGMKAFSLKGVFMNVTF